MKRRRNGFRDQKVGVGIFLALVMLPIAALIFWRQEDGPDVDPVSLCIAGPPQRHRVVLIDTTDKLGPVQRDTVLDVVESEARQTAPFEKFTVAAIDEKHPWEPQILFSRCAPKRLAGGPSENPRMLRANWLQAFHDPMIAAVTLAMGAPGQRETPLIESIYGIGRRPDFDTAVEHRRLVIVSDMLQNTQALYSQYREGLDFSVYAHKPHAYENVPNFSGVVVVDRYLDRPSKQCIQGQAQRRFWEDYFQHAGAAIQFDDWPWLKPSSTLEDYCLGVRPLRHKRHGHRHPPRAGAAAASALTKDNPL